ncbi:polynucleotide kinase-phosphatase [Nocardioides nitrophenolicus]|uniref:polynucleotide kinase-phosphatase n=1 Tax=Nocardioides nitrophenolicus TaxID=60489 RepID=UPI00195903B4|nr:polynucleotide kinase-phosphatase [Nocardioides nitrophenolicus]MBM7515651.1 polynucleotide kinase-phosphatase [Nocardioides nitrophenolicus]
MTDTATTLGVPAMGLVLLVGVSGSGKSTFARAHFRPTEVVSSDFCRGLVADDENDQSATPDAFDVLHYIVGTRLRRGLLTVVDATNVQQAARAELVRLAKSHDVLVDAIVLDVPESVAVERNASRPDRAFGRHVITRQQRDLKRSLGRIRKEGFRRVHVLRGVAEIAAATIERERSWNDLREVTGPFDVIGDVHGCASELRTLLAELGWRLTYDASGAATGASHPEGRRAVFVGDLVDRGPDTPGVLRLVMGMVAAGTALCVSGNHEAKLVRALRGANVKVAHGLAESLDQLAAQPEGFRERALAFMDGLISHYVLDGGRLVVAHAGLKESYHGRASGRVRAFALYGDTTGETDAYGLPVRYPWAEEYRGEAMVVYGHTPVPRAEWVNNTICLDTGVVFGGALTALRYPEREIVAVPAEQEWYAPVRPLAAAPGDREPSVLAIGDVAGTRWLDSPYAGKVKVPEENAAAALEVMSRFAVDPRWLVYLPPTMSPVATATEDGFLEHPAQAFEEYAGWGVTHVVCEEKHMGSRAIAVLARDAEVAERRFGVGDGSTGVVHTRTGRPFFADPVLADELVARLRAAAAPLFASLDTDWLALDCELLPWSAKALGLIQDQYAAVGAAARTALPVAADLLDQAAARGLDVAALADRVARRRVNATAFRDAYASYCRPTEGLDGVTVAPFQILAAEGRALAHTEPHPWHLAELARMDGDLVAPTRHRLVDLSSPAEREAATRWWLDLTAAGGEGMVVKPAHPVAGRVQPGLKVRGREYLRIIYGPDYTDALDLLRQRHLGRKRQLALREHGLGLDALTGFVERRPLWQVHQAVFAVLALESEPVDPRL